MNESRKGQNRLELHPHSDKSMDELMHEDIFTPNELATLLDMDVEVILNAAFRGDLKATIVNHDVVSITRRAALTWMAKRD